MYMNSRRYWEDINHILSIQDLDAFNRRCIQLIQEKMESWGEILLGVIELGEPMQVAIASKYIGLYGEKTIIYRLQQIRNQLPMRCGMNDYRETVDQAIAQIRGRNDTEW